MGWNHRVGTHQIPPDSISNSGLDQRIGTAAAHAVRNVPVAKPEERVGAVLDGMRGSTFDSAVVVAVCTNGRLVGLAPIERLLARRRTP
jgi:magnesium transporter